MMSTRARSTAPVMRSLRVTADTFRQPPLLHFSGAHERKPIMSIKTIYALTICAVLLLFIPTVSAQTEGAGDEVLFFTGEGTEDVPPSWGLHDNVLKDRGHALYISLPFDVRRPFRRYRDSDEYFLTSKNEHIAFALFHRLYEPPSSNDAPLSRPSQEEVIEKALDRLTENDTANWTVLRSESLRLGSTPVKRVSVMYPYRFQSGEWHIFKMEYLFVCTDTEDWVVMFEYRADDREITDDMLDTMFSSVRWRMIDTK